MIHQPVPEIFKDKRIISLDIETTGLNIMFNTIIELGVVEVNRGTVVKYGNKEGWSKKFGGGHSSMYLVRKVHKIKDKERKLKPTFKQCAENISHYLSNSIIVTHNGNAFDIPMIQRKLNEAGFPLENIKSIDTLQLVRKMRKKNGNDDDDDKKHKGRNTLESLCHEFGLTYGGESGSNAHHGLEDSQACLELLFYLVNNNKVDISF